MGRVVSRLFEALLANAVPFLALTALLTIPSLLLNLYTVTNVTQTMGVNPAGGIVSGGIRPLLRDDVRWQHWSIWYSRSSCRRRSPTARFRG